MMHATWCGHCKNFLPVWTKFADELKSNDNVVIGDFIETDNDQDSVVIGGYPTLYFFPKNNKKGIEF